MLDYLKLWFAKFLVEAGVSAVIFLLLCVTLGLFINWCERSRASYQKPPS